MKLAQIPQRTRRYLTKALVAMAASFLVGSATPAQNAQESPATAWTQELNKYPGLTEELARLFGKLRQGVQFPEPRSESRLLPLLPSTTIAYAAIPNYGEAVSKTLGIFRQELQGSAVLRDWWTHGSPATAGPKIEDSLDKLAQFHQYLGDEIVLSVASGGKEPNFAIVAEVKKPGLKKFLDQIVEQNGGKAKSGLQVMEPLDLATLGLGITKNSAPPNALLVLVRADFLVATGDMRTLRDFSARVAQHRHEFASTPFGTRVAQEYQSGLTVLAAADAQKILKDAASTAAQTENLQRSGFADAKYVVWKHARVSGQDVSQMELSFTGPRQGAAAWLAKPQPLHSLEFVSPKPMFAATVVLADLARIYDDMRGISGPASGDKFAGIEGMGKAFNLNLKNDLLSLLSGEITIELDSLTPKQPAWKAILRVTDSNHLQQTLTALLGVVKFQTSQTEDAGVTYYTVRVPSGPTSTELGYAFVGEYLIVASSPEGVREAVRLHANGGSLAKSPEFLASLPPGEPSNASAVFYQNAAALAALQLRAYAGDLADSVANSSNLLPGSVIRLYGEESAIREASLSGPLDVTAPLIVAAIAIPNLLRSRMAANEASAVGSLRSVNVAEVTYQTTYPKRGFAPDLATLGTPADGGSTTSPERANLLAEPLAQSSCTAEAWCIKSGYQFRIKASCKLRLCTEYVVVATPVSAETGSRSFCSASDAVIRFHSGPPLTAPLTVADCQKWPPLQ